MPCAGPSWPSRALALLARCTTLPDGSRWGARATFDAGWSRVGEAALHAVENPWVWAPLAGAAVLQIDDWDQDASDWAYDSIPACPQRPACAGLGATTSR